jgi:hypothetical protein
MDFFDRAALALNPTDAGGDDDGLAEWMCVPHGASAGLEGDVTTADARGLPSLKQRVHANVPGKPGVRAFA